MEARRSRYDDMQCTVSPECQLSDNALRVLGSQFGEVVVSGNGE